jgi:hypothetical protein
MATKFITFGCWNENCCDTDTPVVKVLDAVSKEKEIDFFIVNGDNYYPKKEDDNKIINKDQLKDSFSMLKDKLSSHIYLLLGNHDVEQIDDKCEITHFEKNFAQNNNISFPGPDLVMFKEVNKDTLIIMIDTNIYTGEDITCYGIIVPELQKLPELTELQKLQELQERQKSVISNYLSYNKQFKNIIICGHNPLIGFKNQKIQEKVKSGKKEIKIKGGVDICNVELYSLLFDVIQPHGIKFYYLCADIHNYQRGVVTITKNGEKMNIEQYIVGIGGAHLDDDYNEKYNPTYSAGEEKLKPYIKNSGIIYIKDGISLEYTISSHFSDYGYLIVEVNNENELSFEIKNLQIRKKELLEEEDKQLRKMGYASGGKRNKTKRNKTKRNKTKRNKRNKKKQNMKTG